jgi:hypothetical protein
MGAWGDNGTTPQKSSCDDLLVRLERNDPTLIDVIVLPTKLFGDEELNRLSKVLETTTDVLHVQSLQASGHAISSSSLRRFSAAMARACRAGYSQLSSLAIGDASLGDDGIIAFVDGLLSLEDTTAESITYTLEALDFSYKGMTLTGLVALSTLCNACPSIRHLNLSRNRLVWNKNVTLPTTDEFISACDVVGLVRLSNRFEIRSLCISTIGLQ